MFMAFLYTYAMRVPIITKTVVWGSIWSIFFFALGLAGYAHFMVGVYKAEVPMLKTDSEVNLMQSFSYGFFIGSMAWLCIILYLKDRLTLAIGRHSRKKEEKTRPLPQRCSCEGTNRDLAAQ